MSSGIASLPFVTGVSLPTAVAFYLTFGIALVGLVSTAVWTYLDAKARTGSGAVLWAIGVVLFYPVLLVYLLVRDHLGERSHPPDRTQRVALVLLLGCLGAILSGGMLSPPDPIVQVYTVVAVFPVVVAVVWLLERHWADVLDLVR